MLFASAYFPHGWNLMHACLIPFALDWFVTLYAWYMVFLVVLIVVEYTPPIVQAVCTQLEEINNVGRKILCIRDMSIRRFWKAIEARYLLLRAVSTRFLNTVVNISANNGKFMSSISWALITITVLLFALPVSAGFRPLDRSFEHSVSQNLSVSLKYVRESAFQPMPTSMNIFCNT